MNRFDVAAKIALFGFICFLLAGVGIAILAPLEGTMAFQAVQLLLLVLTLLIVLPGLYLWFTGFRRFSGYLGYWGPKMVLYLCFTIGYAVYIQLKYGRELDHS